jgi:Protein of unknown function (DUF1203)
MDTATQTATRIAVRAIAPEVVRDLLRTDDAGNPPRLLTDEEGGAPLRCCLRRIRPGERVALVSYAPLRRWARETGAQPGPYDEVGPVFVHAGLCEGPGGTGYPPELAGGRRVFRAYSAAGGILGGRLFEPGPTPDPAAAQMALAEMLTDPEVALVHARALEYGCFTFEVRRG